MKKLLLKAVAFLIAIAMMVSAVPAYAAESGLKTKTINQKSEENDKEYKIKKGHYSKVLVKNYKSLYWYSIVLERGVIIDELTVLDFVPDASVEVVIDLNGATIKKLNLFSDCILQSAENGHVGTVNVYGNVDRCCIVANTDKINVYGNSKIMYSGFDWTRHTLKELNIYGENCSLQLVHTCTVNVVNYDYKAFKNNISYGSSTSIKKLNYTGKGDKKKKEVSKKEAKERLNEGINNLVLDQPYTYYPKMCLQNWSEAITNIENAGLTSITQILDLYNVYCGDQLRTVSMGLKIRKDKGTDYSINGIHIGSTTKQLKKAFGKWDESYKAYYDVKVYNYGPYKLLAFIKDDKIVEIQISKSFEEMTEKERKAAKKAWKEEQKKDLEEQKEELEDQRGDEEETTDNEYSEPERKEIELTSGNPVGDAISINYEIDNEMLDIKTITIKEYTAQKLDNEYTRFKVLYSIPNKMEVFVFNPPMGDKIGCYGKLNKKGDGELVFDLKNEDMVGSEGININFHDDDGRCFVYFNLRQLSIEEKQE